MNLVPLKSWIHTLRFVESYVHFPECCTDSRWDLVRFIFSVGLFFCSSLGGKQETNLQVEKAPRYQVDQAAHL